jgi:hypothetical protein
MFVFSIFVLLPIPAKFRYGLVLDLFLEALVQCLEVLNLISKQSKTHIG